MNKYGVSSEYFDPELISKIGRMLEVREEKVPQICQELNLFDFEVVRREYYSTTYEPTISFSGNRLRANTACLKGFPDADYSEVLVNRATKMVALRPCVRKSRETIQWCLVQKGKRTPREVTCKELVDMIYSMMGWDRKNRYKIVGEVVPSNGEHVIAFDLQSRQEYQRIQKEDGKSGFSRDASLPEEWQGHFGLPYHEHEKYLKLSLVDGYVVYSLSDAPPARSSNNAQFLTDRAVHSEERSEFV